LALAVRREVADPETPFPSSDILCPRRGRYR
jgi:hypothetical protein